MNTNKRIRNSCCDTSLAAYGNWTDEEGNDYNFNLQAVSIKSASSPNSSDVSSFSSLSSSCGEPLSDFSELMAQLPIKRGLSKYYKGKSRTFTSLSDVRCVEDLSKKEIPQKGRAHNQLHTPKSNISKKIVGKSCFTSLLYLNGVN